MKVRGFALLVSTDKGYDADERVIELLQAQGKTAMIPPRRNCKQPREYDLELYKARHLLHELMQPNSSNIEPLQHVTINEQGISSLPSISLLPSFGLINHTP